MDYVSDLVTTLQGVGLLIGAAVFGMSYLQGRKRSWFTANLIMLLGGLNTFQYVHKNLKSKPMLNPRTRAEHADAWYPLQIPTQSNLTHPPSRLPFLF